MHGCHGGAGVPPCDVEHEWNGLLSYDREWKCYPQLRDQLRPVILATRARLSGDAVRSASPPPAFSSSPQQ